tara:strand:- start:42 stop:386 length:345 start_codon:yes stop_codon:yes gene_type:complete
MSISGKPTVGVGVGATVVVAGTIVVVTGNVVVDVVVVVVVVDGIFEVHISSTISYTGIERPYPAIQSVCQTVHVGVSGFACAQYGSLNLRTAPLASKIHSGTIPEANIRASISG